ncbi:MAG: cation:proton antiporter [Planctomycetota bacterium]|jgi:Kef-type K+ transport system membrane component KefB
MRRGYLTGFLLAVVLGVVYVASRIEERAGVTTMASSTASVGLLLLGAWMFGRIVSNFRLPKISGYLVFGLLVGPGVMGLISKGDMPQLQLINDLAISLIALVAGGEIKLAMVRRSWKSIASVTFAQVVIVFSGVALFSWLVLPRLVTSMGDGASWQVALLVGVIAAASSPAAVVAVIAELRAHGRMAQVALSSAVCKDMVVVTMFTIVVALIASGHGDEHSGLVGLLSKELGLSVVVGAVVGLGMSRFVRKLEDQLPIVVVLACVGIGILGRAAGLEPLLVALVAGLVMENMYPEHSDPVFETLEELSLPVYCVFFAVAGAKINLGDLGSVWMAAVGLVMLRTFLLWSSVTVGARIGGESRETSRWLWTAFVPQAGVSLALVTLASKALGDSSGEEVFTLVLAAIAIHELVGPILFSIGLTRAGEKNSDGVGPPKTGSGAGH